MDTERYVFVCPRARATRRIGSGIS
jgi:hypothetical protein